MSDIEDARDAVVEAVMRAWLALGKPAGENNPRHVMEFCYLQCRRLHELLERSDGR